MDFLIRAEEFAKERGDEKRFAEQYAIYREKNSVRTSVWATLSVLYSNEIACKLSVVDH